MEVPRVADVGSSYPCSALYLLLELSFCLRLSLLAHTRTQGRFPLGSLSPVKSLCPLAPFLSFRPRSVLLTGFPPRHFPSMLPLRLGFAYKTPSPLFGIVAFNRSRWTEVVLDLPLTPLPPPLAIVSPGSDGARMSFLFLLFFFSSYVVVFLGYGPHCRCFKNFTGPWSHFFLGHLVTGFPVFGAPGKGTFFFLCPSPTLSFFSSFQQPMGLGSISENWYRLPISPRRFLLRGGLTFPREGSFFTIASQRRTGIFAPLLGSSALISPRTVSEPSFPTIVWSDRM